MKKLYSLIEKLAIISIIAIIILISTKLYNIYSNKDNYETKIETIITSMKLWASDNIELLPSNDEKIYMTLYQLKTLDYINNIINPKTKKQFPDDTLISVKNVNDNYEYNIELGININDYKELPILKLNDNVLEYVDISSEYTPDILTLYDHNNVQLKEVKPVIYKYENGVFKKCGFISTSINSIYKVMYETTYNNNKFTIIQNIIVK